jgi:hypothetical protein
MIAFTPDGPPWPPGGAFPPYSDKISHVFEQGTFLGSDDFAAMHTDANSQNRCQVGIGIAIAERKQIDQYLTKPFL